ncbi:RecT family recombinase [Cohnella lubricantis]|uniref:Recombinase RecT n=1 Tax=Cohnella lubricantis TaxID=2163172 RepID=A0A841T2Z5_9BACL|nr:RecT family recombinase [Cohnella lubricantis]MBB6675953.1 recombinase RecT [Cohnella lubricantis]MBP2117930.1 hypothetical protein [Cohnella lubricantis]
MSRSIALVTPETQAVFKPEVLDVIRTSLCPTATDPEFVLFAHKAASYGLDPFKNEIFFIKYGNQARIQFAAEAYLSKAREKEGFQPPDTQVVCENDSFKARKVKREDGSDDWEILEHAISFPRGRIIGAYSIAYRIGFRPVTEFVDKDHIAHMYTGQNKDNWNKWEPDMIGKHVQQRALKRQYGLEFDDDDLHSGTPSAYEAPQRRDITTEANVAAAAERHQPAPQSEPDNENDKMDELRKQMNAKFKQLGITGKEAKSEYIASKNVVKGETPTLQELTKLVKMMEVDIAQRAAQTSDEDDLLGGEA